MNGIPSASSAQGVQYLLTDPVVTGLVGWVGLFVTVVGLWIAIDQILRVKSAANAAGDAVNALTVAIY